MIAEDAKVDLMGSQVEQDSPFFQNESTKWCEEH
jgi:hypothetical protein